MIERLKHYLFLRKILRDKQRQLWATQVDREYFLKYKRQFTDRNAEDKARKKLEVEGKKQNPSAEVVKTLEAEINDARNTYVAFFKTQKMLQELPDYIDNVKEQIKNYKLWSL